MREEKKTQRLDKFDRTPSKFVSNGSRLPAASASIPTAFVANGPQASRASWSGVAPSWVGKGETGGRWRNAESMRQRCRQSEGWQLPERLISAHTGFPGRVVPLWRSLAV